MAPRQTRAASVSDERAGQRGDRNARPAGTREGMGKRLKAIGNFFLRMDENEAW